MNLGHVVVIIILPPSRENLILLPANNKATDKPTHSPSLVHTASV